MRAPGLLGERVGQLIGSRAADAAGTYAQGYNIGVVAARPEATVQVRPWQRMGPSQRW